MDAPWRIELLGCLRASQAERVVHRFRSRKAAALLAYLAFYRDRSHRREQLIELLWPERPREAGRLNLRVELVSLRRQLEPPGVPAGTVILADRASVQLNPAVVTTDVAQFQASLEAARAGAGAEQARRLTAAVELYRGELLPGYYEEWILPERRRLEERFLQALRQLATLSEQGGERDQALHWAARMVTADPLWEEGQYALIRLLAAAGQPAAALRQYEELERLLEQNLGAAPGPPSRALARQIQEQLSRRKDQDSEPAEPRETSPHPPSPAPPAPPPLPAGTVTFLYTDVEASTARWEQVGSAFPEALASHHALLREQFRRHGGCEVKEAGDGFLVAFQEAGSALACAVEAQRALAAHAWPEVVGPLRVRMMLHTADVEPIDGDYHAIELHYGKRMEEAAHGGQLLCSERTARLLLPGLKGGLQLVDLGLYRLRDVARLARLFQVEYPEMAQRQFRPPRIPRPIQGFLPLPFTRFIGREAEIAQLCALLLPRDEGKGMRDEARPAPPHPSSLIPHPSRLVTLTGPGGTGKTRLAREVARRLWDSFNGAVWFVSLADLTDPHLIADRVLETLRLPRSPTLAALDQVIAALSSQPALLLLDNFEHLVSEGAALMQTLLERVEMLTVLVTSRQRVNLTGEQEFPVPPLPVPGVQGFRSSGVQEAPSQHLNTRTPEHLNTLSACASVQLFVDRAQAVDAGFQVTEANAAAVAALCEKLEGLPLALELAAARAGVLTPAQMLGQLSRRLDFLVSRQRDAGPRQRSMRATYDWSYQLLPPAAQRFFARLSVFRGGCTLEAAEAVCEDGPPRPGLALEYLSQLLENSLIVSETPDARQQTPGAAGDARSGKEGAAAQAATAAEALFSELPHGASHRGAPEEKRFRLQEIVREYAAEQLPPEEQESTLQRHAAYYLGLAERAEPELVGEAQAGWLDRLEREHDNLRAALDWAVAHADRGAAGRGRAGTDAVAAPAELGLRLGGALTLYWEERGYRKEGYTRLAGLLAKGDAQARTAARAKALQALGSFATSLGDYPAARSLHEESLAIQRELGDRRALAGALTAFGSTAYFQGDNEAARSALTEGLAISRELGDKARIGDALNHLGLIARTQGDLGLARSLYEQSLATRTELGDRRGIAACLDNLGNLAQEQGDLEQARPLHHHSLAIRYELEDKPGVAYTHSTLGQLWYLQDGLAAARQHWRHSLAIWEEIEDISGSAWALNSLGLIADRQDRYDEARSLLEQSLAIRRQLGDRWGIPVSLNSLGQVARHQGDGERAAELCRESLALFREEGIKLGMVQCLENMASTAAASVAGGHPSGVTEEGPGGESGGWMPGERTEEQAARPTGASASCLLRCAAGAARLFGAAGAIREALGTPLPPVDRADHDRSLAAARAVLGEAAFAAAWAEGRAMELEQAVAYALDGAR